MAVRIIRKSRGGTDEYSQSSRVISVTSLAGTRRESQIMHDRKPSVLIVDDNMDSREILVRIINHAGCSARQASNGKAALDAITAELPDLILLDLMMPEMNGFEFAYRLQKSVEMSKIPVVIISSVARAMAPRAPNVVHVVEKSSFSVTELSEMIREIVFGKQGDTQSLPPSETLI